MKKQRVTSNLSAEASRWAGYKQIKELVWDGSWQRPYSNDKIAVLCHQGGSMITLKNHSSGDTITFFKGYDKKIKKSPRSIAPPAKPSIVNITEFVQKLPIATSHPYATAKGVSLKNASCRLYRDKLIIPCRSLKTGEIISTQNIAGEPDTKGKWPKPFKKGHPLTGGIYHIVGDKPSPDCVFVCEGLSTALSINAITNKMVIMSFGKAHLDAVYLHFIKNLKCKNIILALDNDREETYKTALENVKTITPKSPGDFNDHQACPVEKRRLRYISNSIPPYIRHDNRQIELQSKLLSLEVKVRLNTRNQKIEILGLYNSKWEELTDYSCNKLWFLTTDPTLQPKQISKKLNSSVQKVLDKYKEELNQDPDHKPTSKEKLALSLKEKKAKKLVNKLTFDTYYRALSSIANDNRKDPFKLYLQSIKWDKKPRLEKYLFQFFEIDKKYAPLAEWAFKSILLSAVWRTFIPGHKHDEMVVLSSKQGLGKSGFLHNLLPHPSLFSSTFTFSNNSKQMIDDVIGKVLIEVAELSGFRKSQIEIMKSFITSQVDSTRLSYRRLSQSFPRQAIFVGTTNEDTPLPPDLTGLRRWPVVKLEKKEEFEVYKERIIKDRDNLWGEAVALYNAGESARLPQKLWELSAEIAEENRGGDLVFEAVFKQEMGKVEKNIREGRGVHFINIPDTLKYLKDGNQDSISDHKEGNMIIRDGGGWIPNLATNYQIQAYGLLKKANWYKKPVKIKGISTKVWLPPGTFWKMGRAYYDGQDVTKLKVLPPKVPPIPF